MRVCSRRRRSNVAQMYKTPLIHVVLEVPVFRRLKYVLGHPYCWTVGAEARLELCLPDLERIFSG